MKLGSKSRGDTNVQIASKRLRAERNACPECGRKSAMQAWDYGTAWGRECRWCRHSVTDGVAEVDYTAAALKRLPPSSDSESRGVLAAVPKQDSQNKDLGDD